MSGDMQSKDDYSAGPRLGQITVSGQLSYRVRSDPNLETSSRNQIDIKKVRENYSNSVISFDCSMLRLHPAFMFRFLFILLWRQRSLQFSFQIFVRLLSMRVPLHSHKSRIAAWDAHQRHINMLCLQRIDEGAEI